MSGGNLRVGSQFGGAAFLMGAACFVATLGVCFLAQGAFAQSAVPQLILAGGILLSVLLFAVLRFKAHARQQVEQVKEQLLAANREFERKAAEQKITERLLEHERDLLRTLLDFSPDRIYFKDLDSRFIKCGKAVAENIGLGDSEGAIGKTDFDFFAEEHARAAREMELEIIRTGKPQVDVIEKEVWRDGSETWVLTSKMPLRDKHGNIIGTFGTSKDITALKAAEFELQKEKDLLTVTLRSIGDAVITTDTKGQILLFNKVAEQITGWSHTDAVGKQLSEVFNDAGSGANARSELVRQAMNTGEIGVRDRGCSLIGRDGTERRTAESVAPIKDSRGETIGAVLVLRDITEKLKTETELLRANKLESIGVLAGGIAHDFNNILTVILGNISLARMLQDATPQQLNHVLGEAEKASLRARDLTLRLLTFAKGGAPIKKAVAPAPLLRDCTKAVLQGRNINYDFFIAEDLWSVHADEGQLAQVFHNLLQYARSAAGENSGIDVYACNQEIAADPLLFLKPGRYVRVSIRDHGAALQPDQLNKIFDPYFSSKKQGHGLELATAYSIVRKHEGQIRVESIAGEGTVFHIYLPATDRVEVAQEAAPRTHAPVAAEGNVLVMDDEASIRQLAAAMLRKIGFKPELAADGSEAIAKYEQAMRAGKPYAAVIMDLTIPYGMGGAEAIRQLRTIDPKVKAIVSSGYSNDPVMANFREYGFSGVVPKPYSADDLAAALGDLLGSTDAAQKTVVVAA